MFFETAQALFSNSLAQPPITEFNIKVNRMTIESKTIKEADTKYELHDLITSRWSPRAFSDKPIEDELMQEFFEAASWAPSSMNEQPWAYLYAHREDMENFERFVNCLAEANQVWAKDSAVLMVCLAKKNYDYKGRPNDKAHHDLGMANLQLVLQAQHRDVYGHMMGGFDKEKTIETFEIDTEVYDPVCFMALGYLGNPDQLNEKQRKGETSERERKKLSEFVFKNELP